MTSLTRPTLDGRSIRSPISTSPPSIYVAKHAPNPEDGIIDAELVDDDPELSPGPGQAPEVVIPDAAYAPGRDFQGRSAPHPFGGESSRDRSGEKTGPQTDFYPDNDLNMPSEPAHARNHLWDNSPLLVALMVDRLGVHLHLFVSHKARKILMYTVAGILLVAADRLNIIDLIIRLVF